MYSIVRISEGLAGLGVGAIWRYSEELAKSTEHPSMVNIAGKAKGHLSNIHTTSRGPYTTPVWTHMSILNMTLLSIRLTAAVVRASTNISHKPKQHGSLIRISIKPQPYGPP